MVVQREKGKPSDLQFNGSDSVDIT